MSEVEIIVTGKNLAAAAFSGAKADVGGLRKSADDLALSMRRASLAATSAGTSADRAMRSASAAADKAAISAKEAADAQELMARGIGSAEYAAKAEAAAQRDAAAATEKATQAALANERASLAQASAAKRAGEESAASAEAAAAGSGRMAAGMEKLRSVGKVALEGLVVGAVGVGVESVKMATTWQQQMMLLVTSASESGRIINNQLTGDIKKVSDALLKMSGDTATSTDQLAKGMFFVESAGFHAEAGLKVMAAAAEGAKTENADVTTVVKALTDVLIDYHLKATDSADAMSKLKQAASDGKTNLQEFAGSFASIIPAASAAGISFADASSALAEMTSHGFTAQRAAQNLAQALRSLLNPTKPMKAAFDEFGVSADVLRQKLHGPNGLTDAMQYLSEAASKAGKEGTPEFAAALKRLMGTAPGANAAIATTGANFKALTGILHDVNGATADASGHVKGFSEIQKTFAFQVGQVVDKIKAWVTELGMGLIPKLSDALGWLNKHTTVLKVLAGVIGGVLLVAIGAYTASMIGAAAATIAATWPVLAVVAALGALAAGLVYAYDHSKTFRDGTKKLWADIKVVWDEAKRHWELIVAGILGPLGILFLYFRQHTDQLKKIWKATWAELQKDWKSFENGPLKDIQKALKDVEKWWKQNGAEIVKDTKAYWATISMEIGIALAMIGATVKFVLTMIKNEWRLIWGLVRDITKGVMQAIGDTITTALHAIHNTVVLVSDLIHGRWSKLWSDLQRLVVQGMADVARSVSDGARNFGTLLWDAGKNIVQGLINGINSMVGAVGSTMSNIGSTIRSYLPFSPAKVGPLSGEGSPDKSGAKIGRMLADGMHASSGVVGVAAAHLAHVAHEQHMQHLKHLRHGHHARRATHPAAGGAVSPAMDGPYRGSGYGFRQGGVQYTVTGPDSGTGGYADGGSSTGSSSSGAAAAPDVVTVKVQLEWVGGQHAGDELFKWLKKNIRVRAGTGSNSVQKALGPG